MAWSRSRLSRTAVSGAALLAAFTVGGVVANNTGGTEQTTITGRLLVAVPMGDVPIQASIVTPTGTVPLGVISDAQPAALEQAGDIVQVTGDKQNDGSVSVDQITPVTARAQAQAPLQRSLTVAVVLLATPTGQPPSAAVAQANFFGPTNSVADYYRQQSAGQTLVTGQVFGPYDGGSTTCDISAQLSAATAAMTSHGATPSAFTHIVAVSPNLGCPWAGIAFVGSPGVHLQTIGAATAAHELGHNLGNWHAGAFNVSGTLSDYGDFSDNMGSGTLREFDAWHKQNVGWIPAASVVTHPGGTATYTLTPEETPLAGGTIMVRVGNLTIEKRASIGYDVAGVGGSSTGLDHVWVHQQQFQGTSDTIIPAGLNASWVHGSFTTGDVTISVISDTTTSATVQVCVGTCGPSTTTTSSSTTIPPITTTVATSSTTIPPIAGGASYVTGDDSDDSGAYASFKLGQSITLTQPLQATAVDALLVRKGNANGTCAIQATASGLPSGTALATGTFAPVPTTPTWMTCTLKTAVSLSAGTQYAVIVSSTGGNGSNALYWRNDASNPTYGGGMALRSRSSGAWDATSRLVERDDLFRVR